MENNTELKVAGQLNEREHRLIKESQIKMQQLTYQLGEFAVRQNAILKEIEDLKYSLKAEEHKVIKKYGQEAVINIKTGEIQNKTGQPLSILKRVI